jgi:hypothetical protein
MPGVRGIAAFGERFVLERKRESRWSRLRWSRWSWWGGSCVASYERRLRRGQPDHADLHRFIRFVEQWPGACRQKMALKVLKRPGGEGGLRKPYLMPSGTEVERFTTGLLALGMGEIDEITPAAGLG